MSQINIAASGEPAVCDTNGARGALHDVRPNPISSGHRPAPRLNDGFLEQLPRQVTSPPAGAFHSQVNP